VLPYDTAANESLEGFQRSAIFGGHKANRITNRLRATRAANAVHIVFRMHREIEVNDV
jgi:hypothetical protein